jgi:hypothetical protein
LAEVFVASLSGATRTVTTESGVGPEDVASICAAIAGFEMATVNGRLDRGRLKACNWGALTMPDDRMTRLAEAGNEIQALVARLQERVTQAARDGYDIEDADLFVPTMKEILGEPAINEPAPQHPYQKLRRLLEEAVREIDVKYPRQADDTGEN